MRITRLELQDIRSIAAARLSPGAGINLLVGDNGAGKTSVLEAIHLLGYGRSFRGRVRDGLIRTGAPATQVFMAWEEDDPLVPRRAGLRHAGNSWEAKLDGEAVSHLGELCAAVAGITFEPGSPHLLAGTGEVRRRFVDWGLFHVEHGYLAAWRRHARALKQRNALLKAQQSGAQLDAWDQELADAALPLGRAREAYLSALQSHLAAVAEQLLPTFGAPKLTYQPGWRSEATSLHDALLLSRGRDLAAGHTSVGPHRADWKLRFAARANDEPYSRGQGKLVALSCLLAQARLHAARKGHWPVVLLDDLASELDAQHRRRVLQELHGNGAQVFITGVEVPAELADLPVTLFHVEHGAVTRRD